jgi:hypothetical protein
MDERVRARARGSGGARMLRAMCEQWGVQHAGISLNLLY